MPDAPAVSPPPAMPPKGALSAFRKTDDPDEQARREAEVQRLVELARERRAAEEAGDEPNVSSKALALYHRLLTVDDVKALPPPDWLIEGVLSRRTLGLLWGKPGGGKSFVALDWALSIATGSWWFGREVTKGDVLYVAAEGVGGLGKRIDAWQTARRTYKAEGARILPVAVNLLDREWADGLVELADQLQPALVIADTLARSIPGGDENGSRDMGLAIHAANRIQDATGGSVLFVHHDTREGSNARGHSSLDGAVDTSIECKADDQSITLRCRKQKDARAFDDIKLYRDIVGDSCAISLPNGRGSNSEAERQLLELLPTIAGSDGLSPSQILKVSGIAERSFYRAVKALVEQGAWLNVGTKTRPRYVPKDGAS